MITLFNKSSQQELGIISEAQLQVLIDYFTEESEDDQDYWINSSDIEYLKEQGADSQLIAMLAQALGEAEDMDIEWKST